MYRREVEHCALDGARIEEREEDPNLGSTIGRYAIETLLGSGAVGRVYRVRHRELNTAFAMKILYGDYAGDKEIAARFRREATVLGTLRHPNLIGVTDFGETELRAPFLVMELGEGDTLAARLAAAGKFEPARAASFAAQIASALAEAHARGCVHRDLKPQNTLATKHATGETVKVLDFGFAQLVQLEEPSVVTRSGITFGTPAYMAPEQVMASDVGPAADVYALGTMLFEMIDGRRPFEGALKEVLAAKIAMPAPRLQAPARMATLVAAMLERDPRRRPSAVEVHAQLSAAEVMDSVAGLDGASTIYPLAPLAPAVRPRSGTTLVAVTGVAMALGFFGVVSFRDPAVKPGEHAAAGAAVAAQRVAPAASAAPVAAAPLEVPVRFIALYDCPHPGQKDCERHVDFHSTYELTEAAYEAFKVAGFAPYVASVEHVYAPALAHKASRDLTWTEVQGVLSPLLPDTELWVPPAPRPAMEWLEVAAACAGAPSEMLVWVWSGASAASAPGQGRYLLFDAREAQHSGALVRLFARHFGLSAEAAERLGRARSSDDWAQGGNTSSSSSLEPDEVERVRTWLSGQEPFRGAGDLPCAGLDRSFRPAPLDDFIAWSNGDLSFARERMQVRPETYRPVAGDFDGDGYVDIFWHAPGPMLDPLWYFGQGCTLTKVMVEVNGTYTPMAADFDGDGRDDLYWYRAGEPLASVWWMPEKRGKPEVQQIELTAAGSPLAGDFDGDKKADVLWYREGERPAIDWSEGRGFKLQTIERVARGAPFAGDFDGNGAIDLFWLRPGADRDEIWYGRPSREFFVDDENGQVTGRYQPVAGDFDGDSRTEIFWNQAARRTGVWRPIENGRFEPGRTVIPGLMTAVVGDFDRDGADDIFWYAAATEEVRARAGETSVPTSTPSASRP